MELQAQFLLPDPSQLWGLWRTFISLAAPIPAAWGKTGNWNMEGNDEWSFTETFWHDTHFHNPSPSASYQPSSCISPNLCGGSEKRLLLVLGCSWPRLVSQYRFQCGHRAICAGTGEEEWGSRGGERAAACLYRHCLKETITKLCLLYNLVEKVLLNSEVFLNQGKRERSQHSGEGNE